MQTSMAAASGPSPRLSGGSSEPAVATSHHLPPPIAGYTFLRHLRSTFSHDTFLAERQEPPEASVDEAATGADTVVVRVYPLAYLKRHEQRRNMVEREVLVGHRARHRHVAEAFPPFATRTDLFTVERFYMGGELFESIESYYRSIAAAPAGPGQYAGLPLRIAQRIFRELVMALRYLHEELQLAHRNIKLENILLDEGNHVRLSGLGMCAVVADRSGPNAAEKEKGGGLLQLCCGSKHYVAPELLAGEPYDGKAVDVWAAGVVLFSLVAGCFPFDAAEDELRRDGDAAIFEKIKQPEETLERHAGFKDLPDPQLQNLLRGVFNANPAARLSVTEVLEHPFCSSTL